MKKYISLLILLPGIVWGLSFTVVELILPVIPPFTLTLGRTLISVIMLLILMAIVGGRLPRGWSEWWPFVILASFNLSIPFVLTVWAQKYIDGGYASILLSVMPLFTVLLAFWFTKDETLNAFKIVGVGLGFLGIVLLIGPSALSGIQENLVAQLAIVLAALLYAGGAIYLRHVYTFQPTDLSVWGLRLRVSAAQFIAAGFLLLPFSLILEAPWTLRPTLAIWLYMLFLGIGVTLLATMTYFFLIEELGAGNASMTIYLIPVAGVLSGILVLGERLTWMMVVALVLISAGIFVVNRGNRVA